MSAMIITLCPSTPRNRFARWIKALHRRGEKVHLAEEFARLDRHILHDMGLSRLQAMGF